MLPFKTFLANRLKAKGWSQRELARRLGCSPSSVRRWLTGRAVPGVEYVVRLSSVLGLSRSAMLDLLATMEDHHEPE